MKHRFFVSRELPREGSFMLPSEEARHLKCVLRLEIGDEVAVFDGRGNERCCRISGFAHESVTLSVCGTVNANRTEFDVILACALSKGRKLDFVIEKATELGVSKIIPFEAERSVLKLAGKEQARMQRWKRVSVSAAKQCGRNCLPEIAVPCTLQDVLACVPDADTAFAADSSGLHLKDLMADEAMPVRSSLVLVGPEGGFSGGEKTAVREAGVKFLCLGPYILRAETACIAAVAALIQHLYRT